MRERSCRKRFTMRSSSEWNATTTSRPPSRSTASAAPSARASSSSSRLTKMRSAWNVRVAGWMRDAPRGPAARGDDLGELAGAQDRRLRARPLDGAGDPPGLPLLAVDADDRGELAARGRWFTSVAASAPPMPMRMSSGPSRRNEKPRSASSSCMEETPTSSTTPSAGAKPAASRVRLQVGEAAFDELQPPARLRQQAPRRASTARRIAVDGEDLAAALQDRAAVAAAAERPVDVAAALRRPRDAQAPRAGGPA